MVWTGRGLLFQSLFPAMSVYVRVGKGKSMVSQADTEWSEQRLGTETRNRMDIFIRFRL